MTTVKHFPCIVLFYDHIISEGIYCQRIGTLRTTLSKYYHSCAILSSFYNSRQFCHHIITLGQYCHHITTQSNTVTFFSLAQNCPHSITQRQFCHYIITQAQCNHNIITRGQVCQHIINLEAVPSSFNYSKAIVLYHYCWGNAVVKYLLP